MTFRATAAVLVMVLLLCGAGAEAAFCDARCARAGQPAAAHHMPAKAAPQAMHHHGGDVTSAAADTRDDRAQAQVTRPGCETTTPVSVVQPASPQAPRNPAASSSSHHVSFVGVLAPSATAPTNPSPGLWPEARSTAPTILTLRI
jgi:hypothetical protein